MRSFFVTAHAVAIDTSSVAGVRTSSTRGSTATGLKKCIPTTRSGCSRLEPISVTERDEVFVAMTHSGETTRSSSAKTSFFTCISSKTASITRAQPAKTSNPVSAGDDRAEEPRLPLAHAASLHEVGELVADPGDALVDLLLREVAQHDGHFETAQEEQRELARHESCADDADLLDAPRLGVGHPDAAFGAALDEVERVHRGLSLPAGKEDGQRVLLGAVSVLERPGRGAFDQIERAIGRGRRAVDLAVEARARLPAHLRDVREIGRRTTFSGTLLDLVEQERERLVEELDGLEERVGVAGLERLLRAQHPVLTEGVLDDEPTASSAPTSCGTSCVPPQPGMSPRKTSGQAKCRTDDAIVR